MPKYKKGDKLFINDGITIKANRGRQVRLIEWIAPNTTLNYHGQLVFNVEAEGGWIVTPVDGRNMVARGKNDITFITNIALIKDVHLGPVYIPDGNPITPEEAQELKDLLENSETFCLAPHEFRAFEAMLEANPLSENKALQTLMSKPTRWS